MPGRINVKFLAILGVVMLVGVGGMYGAYKLVIRNPERQIKLAQEHLEKGELLQAIGRYNQAVKLESEPAKKIAHLETVEGILRQMKPETTTELQDRLQNLIGVWNHVLVIDPSNVPAAEKLLVEYHYEQAVRHNVIQLWDRLVKSAEDLLDVAPDHETALVYYAIGQTVRCDMLGLNKIDRDSTRELLDRAIEADPDNGQLAYYDALWFVADAKEQRDLNDEARAEELEQEGLARLRAFVDSHPDDIGSRLGLYRYIFRVKGDRPIEDFREELLGLLGEAEQLLYEQHLPRQTANLSSYLAVIDREPVELETGEQTLSGLVRAERLMRHLVEQDPDDLSSGLMLGRFLRFQGRVDEAVEVFQDVRRDRAIALSMRAFNASDYRTEAMNILIDINVERYVLESDEAKREALMAECEALLEEIRPLAGETNALLKAIEGRLALNKGEVRKALNLLEEANNGFESRNYNVLVDLGRAYSISGEVGAAIEYFEKSMSTSQGANNMRVAESLVALYRKANEPEKALVMLRRLQASLPDNSRVRVMISEIEYQLARREGDATASGTALREQMRKRIVELAEGVKSGDRQAVLDTAQLYSALREPESARDVLLEYYEQNKTDYEVLTALTRIDFRLGNREAAEARVNAALEADADNPTLKRLALVGEVPTVEQVEALLAEEEDVIQRELSLYAVYVANGEQDKAEAALARAVEAGPDDERVLEFRYALAVRDAEWDKAEEIVERVSELNDGEGLDYAGGATWRGRLLLDRGNYADAIRELESISERLKNNSRVWHMLGQARASAGDVAGAERALRQSLSLRPSNPDAWRLLHRVHARMGQHDEALVDLRRAVQYAPRNAALLEEYWVYEGAYGNRQNAIAYRERVAEIQPDNYGNRRQLSQLYLYTGQIDKARASYEALLRDDPDSLDNVMAMANLYRLEKRVDEAKALLGGFLTRRGDEATSGDWIKYAKFMLICGDKDAAGAGYRRAITLEDPELPSATMGMADWDFNERRFEASEAGYRSALEKMGNTPHFEAQERVQRRYAESLLLGGKLDEAIVEVDRLAEANPKNVEVLMLKARVREELLKDESVSESRRETLHQEIGQLFDQAVVLSVSNPTPFVQRAKFYFESEDEVIQASVRDDLREAIKLDPSSTAARMMLVNWAERRGEHEMAVQQLWDLIRARPDFLRARLELAQLCLETNRLVEAERVLTDSISRYPQEPAWYRMRSVVYRASENMLDAEDDLGRAYALTPTPPVLVEYGTILLENDKSERVLEILRNHGSELEQSAILQAMRGRALAGVERLDEAKRAFGLAFAKAETNLGRLQIVVYHMGRSLTFEQQVEILQPRLAGDSSGALELAMNRIRVETEKYDEAISSLEASVGVFGSNQEARIEVFNLLGRSFYETERYERARDYYRKALELDPSNLVALNNLAYILADNLDDPQGALDLATHAVTLTKTTNVISQRANVLDTMGYVQYRVGQITQAEDTLRESIRLKPFAANRLHLAMVYIAQKRPSAAEEQLIEAGRLVEDSTEQKVRDEIERLMGSLDEVSEVIER